MSSPPWNELPRKSGTAEVIRYTLVRWQALNRFIDDGILSLIATAKLNSIDPEAYLRTVLTKIADHPISRIGELLPWNLETGKANA